LCDNNNNNFRRGEEDKFDTSFSGYWLSQSQWRIPTSSSRRTTLTTRPTSSRHSALRSGPWVGLLALAVVVPSDRSLFYPLPPSLLSVRPCGADELSRQWPLPRRTDQFADSEARTSPLPPPSP